MLILGIDPAVAKGKQQAWALWGDQGLLVCGRAFLDEMDEFIGESDRIVCESQYVANAQTDKKKGPAWRSRVEAAIRLARITGRLEEKALSRGKDFVLVRPAQWQTILRVGPHATRETREKAIRFLAQVQMDEEGIKRGARPLNIDMACAICIAQWAAGQEKVKGLLNVQEPT